MPEICDQPISSQAVLASMKSVNSSAAPEPEIHMPTVREIDAARKVFLQHEPRDLFYRVATDLIDMSIHETTQFTVGEALGVLLQTWNKSYYRFRGGFSEAHLQGIEDLVNSHWAQIVAFRPRSIESFGCEDNAGVVLLFTDFEQIVARVGAAKCLHLLAPRFFPLWDNRILTKGYSILLKRGPRNAEVYLRFMEYAKRQCRALRRQGETRHDLLKAIDEYNYCKYTLKEENA